MTGIGLSGAMARRAASGPASVSSDGYNPRANASRVSTVALAATAWSASSFVGPVRGSAQQRLAQPQAHQQGDHLLLRAVMDVAFQPLTFRILPGDQVAPGGADVLGALLEFGQPLLQLLAQPGRAQGQRRLRGEAGEQPLLDRGELLPVAQHHAQRPQQFSSLANRERLPPRRPAAPGIH